MTEPIAPPREEEKRILIHMNNPAANAQFKYPDNFIKTSKYNLVTFLPMNLFEQFRKVSNFYFLVNMVFSLVPGVSPVSPLTAIMPLLFVLGVAAAKDGYEDWVRHNSDNQANSIKAHVVRGGVLMDVQSKDVQVGDIIRVDNTEEFRADILLLSSKGNEGMAFIDTVNLDGETNLKNRRAPEITWDLKSAEQFARTTIQIRCGTPSPSLSNWNGVMVVDGREVAVGIDQFLYRSALLRNTEFVWGVVLYAGVDTKMFRNLAQKPPKFSALDIKLNKL
eukprot:PhF_6_TR27177/c0_g2_i1/m.39850/K01530/E3.6.3.1; phospholipid-translocating ATPase